MTRSESIALLAFVSVLWASYPLGAVPLLPGDIIASGGDTGRLIHIDPETGDRTRIGSTRYGLIDGIAIESATSVLIADNGSSRGPASIQRVDLSNQSNSIVSEGGLLDIGDLRGIALTPWNTLLVGNNLSVIEVDLTTGHQSIFSTVRGFTDIEIENSQNVLVATPSSIVRIHAVSGQEDTLTEFKSGDHPYGIAVAKSGEVFATTCNVSCNNSRLVSIDPTTGTQTLVIEDFMDQSYDLSLDVNGDFLIVGTFSDPFASGIARIDWQSLSVERVTEDALNRDLKLPAYLKVFPVPEPSTAALLALGLVGLAVRRRPREHA